MIIAIDTETGGFEPAANALLSIALVQLDDALMPVRDLELHILPEPNRTIEEGAAKINGYTPERWAERGAIPLRDAFLRVDAWLREVGAEGAQALAHNAPFDYRFVAHSEGLLGMRLPLVTPWICSCSAFKAACPRLLLRPLNHKLETLARLSGHWGPDFVRGDHGAKEDALACAAGYRWLQGELTALKHLKAGADVSMGGAHG